MAEHLLSVWTGLALVTGGLLGGGAVSLFTNSIRARSARLRVAAARLDQRVQLAESRAVKLRAAYDEAHEERITLRTQMIEKQHAFGALRETMQSEFQVTIATLIDQAHQAFLHRANETFENAQARAATQVKGRQDALDQIITPLKEQLHRYEAGLADMRREHSKAQGALTHQLGDLAKSSETVRLEAHRLSTALRSGPNVRGRWGEAQLRNVVELAGMQSHVDFLEHAHSTRDGKRLAPDMMIRLPGKRLIAVDSKVSLSAYLAAMEADDEETRNTCFAQHANDLWTHVKTLSGKDYARSELVHQADTSSSKLDFVIMFVPGENYFAAAMENRPSFFQDAFEKKVLVASPTTLVAMLKSIALCWRQEKISESAQQVAALASDLYESLEKVSVRMGSLGRSMGATVGKYNDLVGTMEARVLPKARRFSEVELPGTSKPLGTIRTVQSQVRVST